MSTLAMHGYVAGNCIGAATQKVRFHRLHSSKLLVAWPEQFGGASGPVVAGRA